SHPVSIPLPESSLELNDERDMGVKARAVIVADPSVRLDKDGKIQCTTCHDPHADPHYQPGVVPHFWVRPTVDEVCLACHELQ
ncbi:MAG: cytochrome c3 family protein, partial [Thermoanaerobaculum sp.]